MSLRGRLLLGTALIAVVLVLAAGAIARATRAHLVDQIDAQLTAAAPRVLQDRGPRPGDAAGTSPLSRYYVAVLSGDGDQLVQFTDLSATDAPEPQLSTADLDALRAGGTITVPTTDDALDYRMQGRTDPRIDGALVVGLPLDDVDEAVRRLLVVEGIAVASVLGVLGLVMWWVIHLGVRPVQRMTETAGAIAAGDLSQRVPVSAPGTEAGALGEALNGMLGRIEGAFDERAASEDRLRQFVADASHELRTPVATIRGYAELYRAGALDGAADLDDAMRRTEQEAVRMGTLVDDLLHLARLDQGRPLDRRPVDLLQVAEDAVRDAQAVDPGRAVRTVVEGPVRVLGDPARLHQVVANLVANALVHAPGAPIEVRVRTAAGRAVLEVADEGPGMSDADARRAFERFYRADASRSRHQGGSGLGLSIVEATVTAHGGTTSLTTASGQGTTVRIELPLPDALPTTSPPGP